MYRILAKLYPRKLRQNYSRLMNYSNLRINADKFVGFFLFFGFGISLAVTFYFGRALNFPLVLFFIATFAIFELLIYFWLMLSADGKARFVEKILPDALQLMASNLKAGMTVDRALLLAARPEFGALQDELNIAGKEIATGKEVGEALVGLSDRIKSVHLEKSVLLIVSGLKSGGKLASLLEQLSKNLRREINTDAKARASVMMYVIFIGSAIVFASPLLFALASYLVEVIKSITSNISIPSTPGVDMPLSLSEVNISPKFVVNFSINFLVTNCILGSLIVGLIGKGKVKYGLKNIPAFLLLSLTIFFIIRAVMGGLLGSMFDFS